MSACIAFSAWERRGLEKELFVRHYQINTAEGAQRGALEERSYTKGRLNSPFSYSSRQKNNAILKAHSSPIKTLIPCRIPGIKTVQ